jgi:biopolymer transport protein ExbB
MKRTLFGGPWRIWLMICAVLVTFGLAMVTVNAPAQGDDDESLIPGDDEEVTPGDDEDIIPSDEGDLIPGDEGEITGVDEGEGTTEETGEIGGLGDVAKKAEAKEDTSLSHRRSFLSMLQLGGPLMFVLLGIEIVVLTLILESCFNVNALKVLPIDFVEAIEEDFEKNDVDAVVQKCEESPGMLSNVLHAGLTAPSPVESDVKESIELAGEHEGESFMSHVGYLSIFGAIAPMVGLLGTVIGMIIAFGKVEGAGGLGKPELLAGGIYTALFTTAFGLIVGIPAMFMYYYFKNRGIKILMVVENSVKRFMKWRSQPDNTGVPRGGLVPQRLALLIDEALSNAFVGIMPVIGFILGPFSIAKAVKIKAELREIGGNPGGALAVEPWKATMALVLGIVDIVIWPVVAVAVVVISSL